MFTITTICEGTRRTKVMRVKKRALEGTFFRRFQKIKKVRLGKQKFKLCWTKQEILVTQISHEEQNLTIFV